MKKKKKKKNVHLPSELSSERSLIEGTFCIDPSDLGKNDEKISFLISLFESQWSSLFSFFMIKSISGSNLIER